PSGSLWSPASSTCCGRCGIARSRRCTTSSWAASSFRSRPLTFERLAGEDFAYLTTHGRKTGRRHRIEIWFRLRGGRVYLLSGGGDAADWVKNVRRNADVRIQFGIRTVAARARVLRAGTREDRHARELLDG